MRKTTHKFTSLVALAICVGIMVCAPLLSSAHVPTTSITIVNNSGREIRHVYLSAPDQNTWGSDQLVNSVISPNGGSFTISDASCSGSSIKVIAEDQEGCFSYQVVSCSEGGTWTITNDTPRDCGN
ncbi:MAG TPA: hypothetical protein VJT50_02295 [Pyrinomonadaceae bacterium]|nr:hypothetical protein [Pyrinomonadaceae bacterium]